MNTFEHKMFCCMLLCHYDIGHIFKNGDFSGSCHVFNAELKIGRISIPKLKKNTSTKTPKCLTGLLEERIRPHSARQNNDSKTIYYVSVDF